MWVLKRFISLKELVLHFSIIVMASIRLDDHYSKDDFTVFKIKASGKITFGLRQ